MNTTESGVVVISTGICIFMLGVIVMLDKALMIAGNFIIIVGIIMLLKAKTFSLFEFDRLIGTIMFVLGIVSLILKHTMLGFILETIGLLYIFKRSIPSFKSILIRLFYNKIVKVI